MTEEHNTFPSPVDAAVEALEQSDSFEAVSRILAAGVPEQVIASFHEAVRELFSQRKLAQMVWIGRAGVEYALRESKAEARKLAYNVSSNLWPGWGDEAVNPTTSDLQAALDLARVHHRLVMDEKLDSETVGNARWLVGAQRLAMGQEQAAHHAFETAKASYKEASKPANESMAEGFQALSLQLMGTMATEGQRRFEAAIGELKQLGDDGEFFADQLQTAKRVFLAR